MSAAFERSPLAEFDTAPLERAVASFETSLLSFKVDVVNMCTVKGIFAQNALRERELLLTTAR